MRFLKKILNTLYIRAVDLTSPCRGKLGSEGFYHYKGFFGSEEMPKLEDLCGNLTEDNDHDILVRYPFLCRIFLCPDILGIVNSYLGKFAQLDYASAKVMQLGKPASPDWHHDSIGHRIKIFVCVNDQTESACTEVIPGSHRRRYSDYNQSVVEPRSDELRRSRKLMGKKGDLLIFDTNLLHRGLYDESPRHLVQIEFSNRLKGLKRGIHFGFRDSCFPEEAIDSPLIRKAKLIRKGDGMFRYPEP